MVENGEDFNHKTKLGQAKHLVQNTLNYAIASDRTAYKDEVLPPQQQLLNKVKLG